MKLASITESSLARAYRHVQNGQFGIITSNRTGNQPEINKRNWIRLRGILASNRLGGFRLVGHWKECQDPNIPYQECPPEAKKDVAEPSMFVPNISLGLLTKLGKEFPARCCDLRGAGNGRQSLPGIQRRNHIEPRRICP
jgi:hypothetical protein